MRLIYSLIIFSFIVSISSCSSKQEETTKKEKTEASPAPQKNKVYTPSGLALLMEEMSADLFVVKKSIEDKTEIPDSIDLNYTNIYTEPHTDDAETNNDIFKAGADAYLATIANLQNTNEQDQVKNFNAVVTACLNCHSNFCPGPVDRIKKLFISVPK